MATNPDPAAALAREVAEALLGPGDSLRVDALAEVRVLPHLRPLLAERDRLEGDGEWLRKERNQLQAALDRAYSERDRYRAALEVALAFIDDHVGIETIKAAAKRDPLCPWSQDDAERIGVIETALAPGAEEGGSDGR